MPHFSFSTVLMALLTSNVIVVFITIPFLKKEFTPCFGYKILFCFIALALLRLLLPFEFSFTNNIFLPQSVSRITAFFREPRIYVTGIHISLWNIFEIVWVTGIAIKLFQSVRSYRRAWNYISKKGIDKTADPKYRQILDDICHRHHKSNNFRVMELSTLTAPIIWDAKEPCIILPGAIDIPPDKLQYALYHEALHYFQHNFFINKLVHFFAIIYWWNPACMILNKQVNLLLEMHVDRSVTRGDPNAIMEYTECLLFIKKEALNFSSKTLSALEMQGNSLIRSHDDSLERRVAMLTKKPSAFRRVSVNILFTILITFILAWSHLYTLETYYYAPPAKGEILLDATAENAYFIVDEFLGYRLYINDVYIDTFTSLEYYPHGIKIYNQEGELVDET